MSYGTVSANTGEIIKASTINQIQSNFDAFLNDGLSSLYQNFILNPCGEINQYEITEFNSSSKIKNDDDTYTLDMWNLISSGNNVLKVSYDSTENAIKLEVNNALERGGIVQFIENKHAKYLKNETVRVMAKVKSSGISAIRMAVLSWIGSADSITTDVVNTWGTLPSWSSNWVAENTASDLSINSTWATVSIENINIDTTNMNNLALIIWIPYKESVSDILYLKNIMLSKGSIPKQYIPRSYEQELSLCKRYFQRYAAGSPDDDLVYETGIVADPNGNVIFSFYLPIEMRITPTFGWSGGTSLRLTGQANVNIDSLTAGSNLSNEKLVGMVAHAATTVTQGDSYYLQANNSASAYIEFDARL